MAGGEWFWKVKIELIDFVSSSEIRGGLPSGQILQAFRQKHLLCCCGRIHHAVSMSSQFLPLHHSRVHLKNEHLYPRYIHYRYEESINPKLIIIFFYPFFFLGVCVCVGVSGEIEPDEPLLTTDVPTWIGVGVGLLVFAALTCMVFKLFSRARFSPARAYGDANLPPPLTPTGSISNHNLFTRNSI